ncbi:DUF1450 domain-containing protein [Paenibacillus wynnii]|uniref:DUF1450 domain-containing protein n=1 Tax=Paenibacillus wynnii TaxID=268407 RepID=UPI0014705798
MNLIEFCHNNLQVTGAWRIKDRLSLSNGELVKVYDCMGYCFDCPDTSYAIVNQKMILDKDLDMLYSKVLNEISNRT